MKKIFIIFLFILSALSSFAQQKSDDFTLTLYFVSAFTSGNTLVIETKGDSAFLKFHIKDYAIENQLTDDNIYRPIAKLSPLINFLNTHKFKIATYDKKALANENTMIVSGSSIVRYPKGMFFDGSFVNALLTKNGVKYVVGFNTPQKGTEDAKLISIIFDLLNNTFTNQGTIDCIERLQQWFPFILGLKKLSDNPLTYKLSGYVYDDEEGDLYSFLKNLPRRKKVIIDMSNYSEMPSLYYPNYDSRFSKSEVNRKEVYWLNPTDQGLKDLHKMGVPDERIIRRKD